MMIAVISLLFLLIGLVLGFQIATRRPTKIATAHIRSTVQTIPKAAPELAVLGAMMLDGSQVSRVVGILDEDLFEWSQHGEIFIAIRAMHRHGRAVNLENVHSELKRTGHLDSAGGRGRLEACLLSTPEPAHCRSGP